MHSLSLATKINRILPRGGGDSPNLPQSSLGILRVPQEHPLPLNIPPLDP